jgi:uncharacterized protein involved in cysteine biosynthesis
LSLLAAVPLAFADIGHPRVIRVFVQSLALTILIFVGAWFGLDAILLELPEPPLPEFLETAWATGSDWAAFPIVIVAAFFLFPAVATGVMSLFLDTVVDAVETRHYPGSPPLRKVGLGESALLGLASFARLLLWNLALLPVYVALLFTAVGPLFLFVGVNGWLMGRDLLEMVAVRHMDRRSAGRFLLEHKRERLALGALTAPMYLVPVLNFAAPILSAALAAHAFHRARR